ncbi:hypothetical protein [Xinfangfangia pollutisoli]|uniref:hypothetical protein n=1 Tax=Xinfangfangia pollutisoli TaxID=2865960 RepID=UPI001CD32ED6|nr:hypothetical protein [Xinfangfangia pollutisoli]
MTLALTNLIRGFRLPSISALVAEVEQTYVNAAETETERAARRRDVANGRFRRWE